MFNPSQTDLHFAIQHAIGLDKITQFADFADFDSETITAILDEAAKIATNVIAPLNHLGDQQCSQWQTDGSVRLPDGFHAAHTALAQGGWFGIEAGEEHGGQALPHILCTAINEMFQSASISFSLCHLLTLGQIHALSVAASPAQKATFLPNMIAGNWTGTMNLSEPHAGTDLGVLRTMATREATPDGEQYRIRGQKVFITYGEHDMADNIIHLVLARTPDAPPGIKGISVFIVPKFLINEDGSLGARNDVKCVSLEHKLGIKASPTAVLQFGEKEGAIGYLVGEVGQGLSIMFAMMSHARFSVGVQGLAISNRAFHQAAAYAKERVQSTPLERDAGAPIIHHGDVLRLLGAMRAEIEGQRHLALYGAMAMDYAVADTGDSQKFWRNRAALLVPIIKGWLTERAVAICSDGVQIHGGAGYIEETGAAQHYRDARILPIYEGTTAIQANDLLHRKTLRDGGAGVLALLDEIEKELCRRAIKQRPRNWHNWQRLCARRLHPHGWRFCIWLPAENNKLREASAVSVPYLMMLGWLCGGWGVLKSAVAAESQAGNADWDKTFLDSKFVLAGLYATHHLPQVAQIAQVIQTGGEAVETLCPDML